MPGYLWHFSLPSLHILHQTPRSLEPWAFFVRWVLLLIFSQASGSSSPGNCSLLWSTLEVFTIFYLHSLLPPFVLSFSFPPSLCSTLHTSFQYFCGASHLVLLKFWNAFSSKHWPNADFLSLEVQNSVFSTTILMTIVVHFRIDMNLNGGTPAAARYHWTDSQYMLYSRNEYWLLNKHFLNHIKTLLIDYYFYSCLGQLKSASSYHPSLIFLVNSAIGGVNEE